MEPTAWKSCTVSIEGGAPRAAGERRIVELHELGAEQEVWYSAVLAGLGNEEVRFEPVFPGRYEAVVQAYAPFDPQAQRLGEPVAFDVTADAPAHVTVSLP